MNFNMVMVGSGQFGASPTLKYFREALSACGHTSSFAVNEIKLDSVNLFLEQQYYPDDIAAIINAKNQIGARCGLMILELYIDKKIPYANNGLAAMSKATPEAFEILRKRGETIMGFVSQVDFVWALLQRSVDDLRSLCSNIHLFPYGYTAPIQKDIRRAEKDIDILFLGKATPHRIKVINAMEAQGLKVFAMGSDMPRGYCPDLFLDSIIDRAKIGLNLALNSNDERSDGLDMRFGSCTRLVQYLERETCIVSEEIPLDNPYAEFCVNASIDQLAATCAYLLQSGKWREIAAHNYQNFIAKMDARDICRKVISDTLISLGLDPSPSAQI
jgi:hypothetical protein